MFLTYEIELNDKQLPTAIRVSFESPVKAVGAVEGDISKVDRLKFSSNYELTKFGKVAKFDVPKDAAKIMKL